MEPSGKICILNSSSHQEKCYNNFLLSLIYFNILSTEKSDKKLLNKTKDNLIHLKIKEKNISKLLNKELKNLFLCI